MKFLLLLVTSLYFSNLYSQQIPNLEWSANFGGTYSEGATDIKQTSDNGFIVCGAADTYASTSNLGFTNFWILKTDENGNKQWDITLGGTSDETPTSILETPEGDFIVAGYTYSTDVHVSNNYGGLDVWVVKLSSSGNILWEKTYGGSSQDIANEIIQLSNGNFMLVGATASDDGDVSDMQGIQDIWLLEIDTNGNLIWNKTYGGSNYEYGMSLLQTIDGGYLIGGTSTSTDGDISENFGNEDFVFFKLDANGIVQWQKTVGGMGHDLLQEMVQNSSGEFVAIGYTELWESSHGEEDYLVVKLDPNGEIIWTKTYGGSNTDEGYAITAINSGGFLLAGMSASDDGDATEFFGYNDVWLVRIDEDGNLIWQKTVGGELADVASSVIQTSDNGFAIAGTKEFESPPEQQEIFNFDVLILKYGEEIMSISETIKSQTNLYPNPVKDILNFSEKLNQIEIYNLSGIKLMNKSEGQNINVNKLPTGTYILKAKDHKGQIINQKFIKK